jgi:hypothetical protein
LGRIEPPLLKERGRGEVKAAEIKQFFQRKSPYKTTFSVISLHGKLILYGTF